MKVTFNQAVRQRAAQLRVRVVTDYGEYEAPPDIARRYRTARQRLDGRPDRRTAEGQSLAKWEREFLANQIAVA